MTQQTKASRERALVIALEQSADTLVRLDFQGVISCISAGGHALTGHTVEELTGANLASFVHPLDRNRLEADWRAVRCGREQVTCTYRTCHREARDILTESTFRLVRDSGTGAPPEMAGVMRDVSGRQQSENAPEEREKLAQMLVDIVVDYAIYLLDAEGIVKTWNMGAQRIKGYTAQEIIGTNFAIFYTPEDVLAGEPAHTLEIARATGKFEAEGWRMRKDGTRLWASVVVDAVRNTTGDVVGFAKITRDLTERVALLEVSEQLRAEREHLLAAKQAAEEANEVKSEFLATMSHEIRTPMNGIIGLTSLLLDDDPTPGQRSQLTLLADAGRSLLAIINDILDLSKVEAGKFDLETIPVSTAGLVDGAMSIVRPEATAKEIALDIRMSPDVPAWVSGDPTRLRQILLNLLTNALKFTERGRVGLVVRPDITGANNVLRFEISDTGIGIAPERTHLLFQNFSQLDRSNARRFGGTGLGLAISKRLAEAMQGTIGMTSTVGVGSIFWFTALLPATGSELSLPVASRTARSPSRRILVVDDNPINQIVARGMLMQDGHAAVVVDNGAEAVAAVLASSFDLVLMDMQMPVMDGLEATRRIRALSGPVRNMPIVALTANAMAKQVAICHEAGMNDHLAKPIDRELLRKAIATWTGHGRNDAEPPHAASERVPALETAPLLELFNGDRTAVANLLSTALASIRTDLARIDNAAPSYAAQDVSEAAHRIKGTSGSLHAQRLVELGSLIEQTPLGDRWTVTPSLVGELHNAVAILSAEIETYANRAIADG